MEVLKLQRVIQSRRAITIRCKSNELMFAFRPFNSNCFYLPIDASSISKAHFSPFISEAFTRVSIFHFRLNALRHEGRKANDCAIIKVKNSCSFGVIER